MSPPDLSGSTALVTGASSGIGAAIARQLAAWKCDLVLTARREDRLDALAGELRAARRVDCTVLALDLAGPGGAARLHERVREGGRRVDILINNAGFAIYRRFADTSWQRHAELLQLNVLSLVELTYLFLPHLASRPRAHVLNVSSPVGPWIDVPAMATYGASKAAVLGFSRALAAELGRSNVRVPRQIPQAVSRVVCVRGPRRGTCLGPGGTTTEFSEVAGQTLGGLACAGMMSAQRCAAIGLRGMLRGRRVVVPGATNKLIRLLSGFVPRRWMGASAMWMMGPPQGSEGTAAPTRDTAPGTELGGAPPRRGHGS